ncbi:MAG: hypothetical protein ACR2MT_12355, partial [Aurantibacter sp.]
MKTKIGLVLLALALVALADIFIERLVNEQSSDRQKASFSFIKCTAANFLLKNVDTTQQIAPLFENLGTLEFKISTEKELAQTFFNQGLKLTYAFNHAEAHRSFLEASRLDPNSAMTYWGQAYALGPNINDPLPDDERKQKCYETLMKASKLASRASQKEQALIEALKSRYSDDMTADIEVLNMNYMHAMAKVLEKFPEDADVQVLYAASVMNTVPWNYWDADGNPSPNIPEAKAALEKAMEINP